MKKFFKLKYRKDPIWSRVVSFILICLGFIFCTTLFIFSKSIYENKPIWETSEIIFGYFKSIVDVNIFFVYIALILFAGLLLLFFSLTYKKLILSNKSIFQDQREERILRSGTTSNELFANRLEYAFPGQRGFKWYYSRTAVRRLEKVFKPPLKFGPVEKIDLSNPFWWFRAGNSRCIDIFKKLSKVKVLIGSNEFKIKRIGVFVSPYYDKSFIYVETGKEKQTGINNLTKLDIKSQVDGFGCSFEEYALLNERIIISKDHYDDGGTTIKGKIIDTSDAELRKRYLSDYNFLIAANQSAFNSHSFEEESQDRMDRILKAEIKAEEFIERLKGYNNKEN